MQIEDDEEPAVSGAVDAHTVDPDMRDAETFDDGEFYSQLLKELLDKGSAGAWLYAPVTRNHPLRGRWRGEGK
jgi:hypothetical protein